MNKSQDIKQNHLDIWSGEGNWNRFQSFQDLMRFRIRDILLVSSLYDLYLFEEDGRLYELIRKEYHGLNLSHSPELTRVSSGRDAINIAKKEKRFDLIITTLHIEDMHAIHFAKLAKKAGLDIPIILLALDNRELKTIILRPEISVFDNVFLWTGDYRLILGIIKYLEDKLNVEHDSKMFGVQNIILIEDNVRYYSSFLPIIYTELLKQSQRLITEGVNLSHKFLRMRARPKILLCTTYEDAWAYYRKYQDLVLGIISDIAFPRKGKLNPKAGIIFAKAVKKKHPDIPIALASNNPENEKIACDAGASFLLKNSPTLIAELQKFMNQQFGFGDFVFKNPDGKEVALASDLKTLEDCIKVVPSESIRYHGERNHFSNWLKARTEFWLAHKLRPRKISDYANDEELRKDLVESLHSYRTLRQRGIIEDFNKETFDPESSFARLGGGSLGGKARGLGFLNSLITNYNVNEQYSDRKIFVPPAVVIGTDVFDDFMQANNLLEFAINCEDDEEITERFLESNKFPEDILKELAGFLEIIDSPLAVRSSSLLEDSQYHPFAGVYQTYMIPNNDPDLLNRLNELLTTIKRVFASTYYRSAKDYLKITSYRSEEEKMAVIIQKMIGNVHKNRFYPDFAGVAKSYNYYPLPPQKQSDGIASVALGLGKYVVEGGNAVRFCPKYPEDIIQFYSVKETLDNSQRNFFALKLDEKTDFGNLTHDMLVKSYQLDVAEKDGTLNYVGATYSPDNDAIYDGLARSGPKVVTFGPILKNKLYPLPQILQLLLDIGTRGIGTPVELEFAVNLSSPKGGKKEFGLLQMRPLVIKQEDDELEIESFKEDDLICQSNQVLGHGIVDDVYDIIVVDYHKFERSKSRDVAAEVTAFNYKMLNANRPYLLIGVGRWGSLDPWLGIPVTWEQIAGAKAIVETSFKDMIVKPSQGSHFFQNITSFMIGYFTINPEQNEGILDWDWLLNIKPFERKHYTRHLRFKEPIVIKMNGHKNEGIILKPKNDPSPDE
ncbi:phosphoenolpyruvate synthase [bacterium BMS3Abin03]|nr:phosphoenolpyruvate synthase [bacterium BMS3Abin03]